MDSENCLGSSSGSSGCTSNSHSIVPGWAYTELNQLFCSQFVIQHGRYSGQEEPHADNQLMYQRARRRYIMSICHDRVSVDRPNTRLKWIRQLTVPMCAAGAGALQIF